MDLIKNKSIGAVFVVIAFVITLIGFVRYLMWAPAHNTSDGLIIGAAIIGLILNIIVLVKDIDILIIAITACYSFAVFKHLANQVGSFVDAFQGINMFGDATQVGNIISIAYLMGIGVILTIISGFLKREKY